MFINTPPQTRDILSVGQRKNEKESIIFISIQIKQFNIINNLYVVYTEALFIGQCDISPMINYVTTTASIETVF